MERRTDIASELVKRPNTYFEGEDIKRTEVMVDEKLSQALKKPQGIYITVESDAVIARNRDKYERISRALAKSMCKNLQKAKSILVVGLGNPNMTADSLGTRVANKLTVTRHIKGEKHKKLSVITPNVLGVTGIESFDVVSGVCEKTHPDLIIAVDSLASAAVSRIATAFQISTAGITPGSGVSNHRATLNQQSLGVPVLSMGVPLVVYASTIIQDATGKNDFDSSIGNLIVTPKDIDLFVEECAEILSNAIHIMVFEDWDE